MCQAATNFIHSKGRLYWIDPGCRVPPFLASDDDSRKAATIAAGAVEWQLVSLECWLGLACFAEPSKAGSIANSYLTVDWPFSGEAVAAEIAHLLNQDHSHSELR